MRNIEVKDQVRLSLGKCMELVLSGVRFRLFRAAITVVVVALAVAFLMTMLSESLIARRATGAIKVRIAPRQNLLFWVSRLSVPLKEVQLTEELAAIQEDKDEGKLTEKDRNRSDEYKAWGSLGDQDVEALCAIAKRQGEYLRFFDGLSEGHRRVLLGRLQGAEVFPTILGETGFNDFKARLLQLGRQIPTGIDGFRAFLNDWGRTRQTRGKILEGNRKALERIKTDLLKDQKPKDVLAAADAGMPRKLAEYGYRMSDAEFAEVRSHASLSVDAERIKSAGKIQEVKTRLAARLNIKNASDISETTLLDEAASGSGAEWLLGVTNDIKKPIGLSAKRIQEAAQYRLDEIDLAKVETGIQAAAITTEKGWLGFSSRTKWLIVVSFLVCIVGIANAMLMSVTERFREIATMKCLGATDSFIMINFILESCMQGIAGGVVGAFLGFLLGGLRSWARFGWVAMQNLPGVELLIAGGLSIVMGVVLSAGAAVYPAYVAARLAPMEAMRIE